MAADESSGNGRINVSRDLLRAELGGLELRIVDRLTTEIAKKADQEDLRALRHRLQAVEAQGPLGDRIMVEFLAVQTAVDELRVHGSLEAREALAGVKSLEGWRNRLVGAYVLLVAAIATYASLHPIFN